MRKICLAAVLAMATAGLVWAAQEKGGQDKGGQESGGMPKPSKEHDILKESEGTWDYIMKFKMGPDQPEMQTKGTEVCSMVGGFWSVFDIKTPDMMGQPWHGHGFIGYDPEKKKYIGTFINSSSFYVMTGEGTSDGPGKLTMNWDGKHEATGKNMKMREVSEHKDKDHGTMTMYGPGPDGKEVEFFTIQYTRKGAK